jgi:phosphatidylserine/phosphatidylglycerophosphate/cardiolipin synthase-like enzyme
MSTGSLLYNRELGVILDDPTQLAKILAAMNTDFANASKQ